MRVTIGGIIESCRNVTTKNGNQPMCFCKVSDLGKSVEAVVFPKTYAATPGVWQPDNLVLLTGKLEMRDTSVEEAVEGAPEPEVTIIVDTAVIFTGPDTRTLSPQPLAPISIEIPKGLSSAKLVALNTLLQSHRGQIPASLVFYNGSSSKTLPLPYGLNWTPNLQDQIRELLKN